ncbi:MBL fold metallo-hydrolase, partial [Veillonella atypica]|uniref:MBL fold metallo-hydrolase RNA specificity domain-containing protein n=1 Tax=Veillonella atypica TaxID=39777 RepID=UPI0030B8D674|nr:MBL fold metallo-hydrolase [Veillonella atypica]
KELLDTYPSYICHASGHVSKDELVQFIEMVDRDSIIPVHTESPEKLEGLVLHRSVCVVDDGEAIII